MAKKHKNEDSSWYLWFSLLLTAFNGNVDSKAMIDAMRNLDVHMTAQDTILMQLKEAQK